MVDNIRTAGGGNRRVGRVRMEAQPVGPVLPLIPIVRLPRCVLEALEAASEALEDLGACDDPQCRDENCNHALTKVRDVLAEQ